MDLRLQFGEDVVHQLGQWIQDDLQKSRDVIQQDIKPIAVRLRRGWGACGSLLSDSGGRSSAGNICLAFGDPF